MTSPELMRIFRDELVERCERLVDSARELRERRLGQAAVPDLVRDAHTIKGSAGLLGVVRIREAARRIEQAWRMVSEGYVPPPEAVVAMEAIAGRLPSTLERGLAAEDEELTGLVDNLGAILDSVSEFEEPGPVGPESGTLGGLLSSVSESLLGGATRVDTSELYRLINRVVEVSLDAEALADLTMVSIEGSDPALLVKAWRGQLERLNTSIADIQDQAVALANVSFWEATSTFPQFVRYLGRRMGKDLRFEMVGQDVQLDRQIVDLMREPLRHLLVNAVDHGIEPSGERVAAGKPATGLVSVGARVVEDRVQVSVSDDGRGVDWGRVTEVAEKMGLPTGEADLTPLLFHPGFSTTTEVTDFSGTGEGLSTVREMVERVHGAVHLETRAGQGTTVILTLPMSMVLQNVVVVATNGQFWGLPAASVEAAMPLSKAEIRVTDTGRTVRFESVAVPVVSLAAAVGSQDENSEEELLVVNTRSGLVAVTVAELIDRRRVAVKNLGPIIEGTGHVTGAALLGGGEILVVLDPNFLGVVAKRRPHPADRKPRILVVDDSAGVRQLLSATLNGAGFEVTLAASAREAVMAMTEDPFDALVVDYSMPRSNGVDLVRALRAAEIDVPIVMVSGVATPEEKKAAWDAGVDGYLDKFDLRRGVLTATLRRLLGLGEANSA